MKTDSLIALAQKLKIKYSENEAMSLHTSFKIGGAADIILYPENEGQLAEILSLAVAESIPTFILGKGSNLLVSDDGIEGAVISTLAMQSITPISDTELKAEAGASLAALCRAARDRGLTGLEFAYGIPGTVGGALYMNAGAYGGDMSMVVKSAESINADNQLISRTADQMALDYRKSIYDQNGEIITSVTFSLEKGDKNTITDAMDTFMNKRKNSQPLDFPSAGSTFKRPEGYYAAALIDECGLKGFGVGGAEVSVKHAGFVINKDNASCSDVLELIGKIKKIVMDKRGVELNTEVIHIGR